MVGPSREDRQDNIPEEHSGVLGEYPYGYDSPNTWETEAPKEEDYQEYEKIRQEEEFAQYYAEEQERYAEYLEWCNMVGEDYGDL